MNQNQRDLLIAALRLKPAAAPMTAKVSVTAEAADFLTAVGTGHAVWTSISSVLEQGLAEGTLDTLPRDRLPKKLLKDPLVRGWTGIEN